MLHKAKGILEKLNNDHPNIVEYRGPLAEALAYLGKLYRESGHSAIDAMNAYQDARRILERAPSLSADELYVLAGVLGQCVALASAGVPHTVPHETALPPVSLDHAVETMRRSVTRGFRDLNRLRRDTNIDPLRSRADFRLLTLDMAFPTRPFSE